VGLVETSRYDTIDKGSAPAGRIVVAADPQGWIMGTLRRGPARAMAKGPGCPADCSEGRKRGLLPRNVPFSSAKRCLPHNCTAYFTPSIHTADLEHETQHILRAMNKITNGFRIQGYRSELQAPNVSRHSPNEFGHTAASRACRKRVGMNHAGRDMETIKASWGRFTQTISRHSSSHLQCPPFTFLGRRNVSQRTMSAIPHPYSRAKRNNAPRCKQP
jgi:hypothetical protein